MLLPLLCAAMVAEAFAQTPKATPFVPSHTALNGGGSPATGNPLDSPAYHGKEFPAVVLQSMPEGILVKIQERRILLTGLPAGFVVADHTGLKVRLAGKPTPFQYTTLMGSLATVDAYPVEGTPRITTKPLR